jgi:hypothetical protein
MKKLLILIAVFIVIAAGAAAVFIATFDVNRYRPVIEQKLTEAAGNPVSIGAVGLAWNGALTLEVSDIVIREEGRSTLTVKRAAAALDVFALLSKRVSVPSVEVIEPQIVLIREGAGEVRVGGVRPAPMSGAPSKPAVKPGAGAAAVDFAVKSVRLRGGHLTFVDQTGAEPVMVQVRQLDADVKNLALGSEVTFAAKAAVFADGQNLEIAGKAKAAASGAAELKDVVFKTDLARLDWKAIAAAVPAARDLPFRKDPGGVLTLRVPALKIVPGSAPEYVAQAELAGGSIALRDFQPEITSVGLSAQVDPRVFTLKSLTADLAGGSISASGTVQDWLAERRTAVKLEAKKLRIEPFLPAGKNGKTQFEGEMGAAFDGSFTSFEWPLIQKNLNGRAAVDLPGGVLLNMNLVREMLGKLDSLFPGIVGEVETRLPAAYKPKLTQQSTVLNPFRHTFEIVNGTVLVRGLSVATDFFAAGLDGDLALAGTFEGRGSIQMDKTFSNAMFEGAPPIRVLANAVSQVELPLKIRYRSSKLSVLPDLEEIGRRIIPRSGEQLLKQALGIGAAAAGSSASGAAASTAGGGTSSEGAASSAGGWLSQIQNIAGAAMESQKSQQ